MAQDRDEVFVEMTSSICPVCKEVVDGEVNIRQDQVVLRKRCAESAEDPDLDPGVGLCNRRHRRCAVPAETLATTIPRTLESS